MLWFSFYEMSTMSILISIYSLEHAIDEKVNKNKDEWAVEKIIKECLQNNDPNIIELDPQY